MPTVAYARKRTQGLGTGQAIVQMDPPNIVANYAPTDADKAEIGTNWYYPAGLSVYARVSNATGGWVLLSNAGGSGVFTSLTVTPGPVSLTGTVGINTAGAGVTTIGTGGTGAVAIGNATGNTAVTGSLTASNGLISTAGGITATVGNINAANGNVSLGTAGNKLSIATGANASIGTATLAAGTVTVATTAVTASSKIFLTVFTPGGTPGLLSYGTIVAGTSFVINSDSGSDTSVVNWWIIN